MKTAPTSKCATCGSILFYKSADGSYKCAKHEPSNTVGLQFVVAQKAERAAKRFMDELESWPASEREAAEKILGSLRDDDLMTQAQFDSAIEQARKAATKGEQVEPRLNLKVGGWKHGAVQATKAMTVPVAEGSVPASDRDVHGRATKRKDDDEAEVEYKRDFYGRRRAV